MNILYLGQNHGTSRHRADALRRLGHNVMLIDPWVFFPEFTLIRKAFGKLTYEVGPAWLEPFIYRCLAAAIKGQQFDVIWTDQCEFIGPKTLILLKKHAKSLITYLIDDPFGSRDKKRFSLLRKSIHLYDLITVVRFPNVKESHTLGAKNVILVTRSADEVAHASLKLPPLEEMHWSSDVAFIGTWMPERGPLILRLLQMGVPVSIYGDRWQKASEWRQLKRAWKGPGLAGLDYTKAIQSAKICLGLLSKGNRDLHTTRSAEIPYIGSLLCAERTAEHVSMYKEDEEAVFWTTPEECAYKCQNLLNDESKRKRIAEAGRQRCISSGYLNEPVMGRILDVLLNRHSAVSGHEPTISSLCYINA